MTRARLAHLARGGEPARMARYVAVGVVATAAHYALLMAAVELGGWPAWLASGLGATFGAQVAYLGNRALTFRHRGAARQSWPRFQATALLGAVVGMGIVAGGVRLGWHYLLAQVAATGAGMVLTYLLNRHWTFAPTRDPG